jgi:nuclear transport factor 2 (NTF2) superfamily protein
MTISMTEAQARTFAEEWMDAWNSHDADRVAAHYHPDVEYYSPFVARLSGADLLRGRDALREYAAAALARYPDLHFGPECQVAAGAGSVVIAYRSVDDLLAMETLVLDEAGLVVRAHCHYAPATASGAGV